MQPAAGYRANHLPLIDGATNVISPEREALMIGNVPARDEYVLSFGGVWHGRVLLSRSYRRR